MRRGGSRRDCFTNDGKPSAILLAGAMAQHIGGRPPARMATTLSVPCCISWETAVRLVMRACGAESKDDLPLTQACLLGWMSHSSEDDIPPCCSGCAAGGLHRLSWM